MWREITILIAVKLLILAGIHKVWFSEPLSEQERVEVMSTSVYGQADGELIND